MNPIAIHAVEEIACAFEPRDWPWAEGDADRIETHWQRLVADKPALFDGPVMLMHRWEIVSARLQAACFQTKFSRFIAWRDFGFPDTSVRNGYAMAALVSADGAFILGEMNSHTANAGRIYFPAGTPDADDRKGATIDLEGSVLRELAEETGLSSADVVLEPCWTVLISDSFVACLKIVRAQLTADALVRRIDAFLAREEQPELARMHIVRHADDIHASVTPSVAAFLRDRFARET